MKLTYSYADMQEAKQSMYLLEASVTEVEVTLDVLDEMHGEPNSIGGLDGDRRTTWSPTGQYGRTIKDNRPTATYQEDLPTHSCWSESDFEPRSFHWDISAGTILEWVVE